MKKTITEIILEPSNKRSTVKIYRIENSNNLLAIAIIDAHEETSEIALTFDEWEIMKEAIDELTTN